MLAAKLFPGCEVTLGQESEGGGRWPHASTVATIKQMGAKHVKTEVTISFLTSLPSLAILGTDGAVLHASLFF